MTIEEINNAIRKAQLNQIAARAALYGTAQPTEQQLAEVNKWDNRLRRLLDKRRTMLGK